jgi:hypothetical protein
MPTPRERLHRAFTCRRVAVHSLPPPRRRRVPYAFDLIELNGDDLRRDSL